MSGKFPANELLPYLQKINVKFSSVDMLKKYYTLLRAITNKITTDDVLLHIRSLYDSYDHSYLSLHMLDSSAFRNLSLSDMKIILTAIFEQKLENKGIIYHLPS